MNPTKIEWCTHTWNPVTGCLEGCRYCYARRIADRFAPGAGAHATLGHVELCEPERDKQGHRQPWPMGFRPTFHRYRRNEPLHHKGPARIFVCSMGELFGPWVPQVWTRDVMQVAQIASQRALPLDFLFLTKHPERLALFNAWPVNAWAGATVTNQADLERTLPHLAAVDAWPRWLSVEPMRGEIRLPSDVDQVIDWIVIGAETGPGATPPRARWVEQLTESACELGLLVFHKDNLRLPAGATRLREVPGTQQLVRSRARRAASLGLTRGQCEEVAR